MKIGNLVKILKTVEGRIPVIAIFNNKQLPLSRDFENYGIKLSQFNLKVDPASKRLDSDFLKAILDYTAKEETRSLFSKVPDFLDFNVIVLDKDDFYEIQSVKVEKIADQIVMAIHLIGKNDVTDDPQATSDSASTDSDSMWDNISDAEFESSI